MQGQKTSKQLQYIRCGWFVGVAAATPKIKFVLQLIQALSSFISILHTNLIPSVLVIALLR